MHSSVARVNARRFVSLLGNYRPTDAEIVQARQAFDALPGQCIYSYLYRYAMDQRVCTHLIANLPRIGVSPEELSIPTGVFQNTPPLPQVIAAAWQHYAPEQRITFAQVQGWIDAHFVELKSEMNALHDALGTDGFMQIKGLALHLRFPHYDRHAFDLDTIVPRLHDQEYVYGPFSIKRGFSIYRCQLFLTHPPSGWSRVLLRKQCAAGNWVVVDVLAGNPPCASPSLPNPIMTVGDSPPSELWARSRLATVGRRTFRIPSDEDALLLIASQVPNYGFFQLRTFIDVRVLLAESASAMDWDYIVRRAGSDGYDASLLRLLERAELRTPNFTIPHEVRRHLRGTWSERTLVRLSHQAGRPAGVVVSTLRLLHQARYYRFRTAWWAVPWAMLKSWRQFHLLNLCGRSWRRGRKWIARRFRFGSLWRPSFGSVCELHASSSTTLDCPRCLAKLEASYDRATCSISLTDSERLITQVVSRQADRSPHACEEFRFYYRPSR